MTYQHQLTKTIRSATSPHSQPSVKQMLAARMMQRCINWLISGEYPVLKAILSAATDYVQENGEFCVTQESLAQISGFKRRAISMALAAGVRLGYLQKLAGGDGRGRPVVYRVVLLARYREATREKYLWHRQLKGAYSAPFRPEKGAYSAPLLDKEKEERDLRTREPYPVDNYEETQRKMERRLGPKPPLNKVRPADGRGFIEKPEGTLAGGNRSATDWLFMLRGAYGATQAT